MTLIICFALQLLLKSPVLLEEELAAIVSSSGLSTQTFRLRYTAGEPGALAAALKVLCSDVEAAVKAGCEVLVLSDRIPEGEEVRCRLCCLCIQWCLRSSGPPSQGLLQISSFDNLWLEVKSCCVVTDRCIYQSRRRRHTLLCIMGYSLRRIELRLERKCTVLRVAPKIRNLRSSSTGTAADACARTRVLGLIM